MDEWQPGERGYVAWLGKGDKVEISFVEFVHRRRGWCRWRSPRTGEEFNTHGSIEVSKTPQAAVKLLGETVVWRIGRDSRASDPDDLMEAIDKHLDDLISIRVRLKQILAKGQS